MRQSLKTADRPLDPLFEGYDDLIRSNEPELPTDHFVGQVRIGLSRVEQGRTMAQVVALVLELCELNLPLIEVAMITTPGKQSIWTGDGMAGEGADDRQRQRRHCRAADQSDASVSCAPHGETESESGYGIKQFCFPPQVFRSGAS